MDKYLYVISHTHWDREWYQNFQEYRVRLVRMMDDLLDVLEQDAYPCFHLDGQTIVLKDYLEIRPQNRQRLEKLIKDGRIVIGPWYVMPDEFLVSGESLVRNLQLGHRICRQWDAKPMCSGYVTDIFGHNSQFPQILRGFDIDNALLYRGIADYPKDAFHWKGADGSEVTAFKMDRNRSYSNFYFAVRWPFEGRQRDMDETVLRMQTLLDVMQPQCITDVMLMMDGVDHIECDPEVPDLLKKLEEKIPGIHFVHTTFEAYKKAYLERNPELETLEGPLYNPGKEGINNQVLKNVLSSMVFLKQQNDQCETELTAWAEPLDFATWLMQNKLPKSDSVRSMEPRNGFLHRAWDTLMENHPHDSICGCSISTVHQDNQFRFRQCIQIAQQVTADSIQTLCAQIHTADHTGKDGAVVLFNASDRDYAGVGVFTLDLEDGQQKNFRFYDESGVMLPYQILSAREYKQKISEFRKLIRFPMACEYTIAMPVQIPAHGYASYSFDNLKTQWPDPTKGDYTYPVFYEPVRYLGTMRISADTFDTGCVLVKVESNGTLTVTDKKTGHVFTNLLLMENGGDCGDGWVYRQPEHDSVNLGLAGNCQISLEADGPLVAELKITKYLPSYNGRKPNDRYEFSEHNGMLKLVSFVRMCKDSSKIEVQTVCENTCDNHRLRVAFDTNLQGAEHFYTKTPYDMQKWPIAKADCSNYVEKDTQENPSQGITYICDGKAAFGLYTRGLYELECRDNSARTLVLTLLRAVEEAAGLPEGSAAMKDRFVLEYCMDFAPGETAAQAYISGESWRGGIRSAKCGIQTGNLTASANFYRVEGNGNTVVAAAVQGDWNDQTVIRLLNIGENPDEGVLVLDGSVARAYEADLRGSKQRQLDCQAGCISYRLEPKKLLTIVLERN